MRMWWLKDESDRKQKIFCFVQSCWLMLSIGLLKSTSVSSKIGLSEGEEIVFDNFKIANFFNNLFYFSGRKNG